MQLLANPRCFRYLLLCVLIACSTLLLAGCSPPETSPTDGGQADVRLLTGDAASADAVAANADALVRESGAGLDAAGQGVRDAGSSDSSASPSDASLVAQDVASPDAHTVGHMDSGSVDSAADSLEGVWQVTGQDQLGSYSGRVDLSAQGQNFLFSRAVTYDNLAVEDGRVLSWAWQGQASALGTGLNADLSVSVELLRNDFVRLYHGATRTAEHSTPIPVNGTFTGDAHQRSGVFVGAGVVHGTDLNATETWTKVASSTTPPVQILDIQYIATHDPGRPAGYSLMRSYQDRPEVQVYANDPAFIAAIHKMVIDRNRFDFYRAHAGDLRVVNKVVDAVSLVEEAVRADAYRYTLHDKAAHFDTEMQSTFIDASAHMVGAYRYNGQLFPSGDSALWTACYVASQVYRYWVTASAEALSNIERSLDAMLILQEITGDPTTFARTLRPAQGGGGLWHAGTGAYAAYDWMEGGNNDMFMGLEYANLLGYLALCQDSSHPQLCARITTNVRQIADNIDLGGGLLNAIRQVNTITSKWLAGLVTGEASYLLGARLRIDQHSAGIGPTWREIIAGGNAMIYDHGVVDWSGTHLNFVQYLLFAILSQNQSLGGTLGDAADMVHSGITAGYTTLARVRNPLWSSLYAGFVPGADVVSVGENVRKRLQEFPFPKRSLTIDDRINPDWVMSPYPALPWKRDWDTQDRGLGLYAYPLFASVLSDYTWKDAIFTYKSFYPEDTEIGLPGTDYLHAYWLGRYVALITESD